MFLPLAAAINQAVEQETATRAAKKIVELSRLDVFSTEELERFVDELDILALPDRFREWRERDGYILDRIEEHEADFAGLTIDEVDRVYRRLQIAQRLVYSQGIEVAPFPFDSLLPATPAL